MSTMLSNEKGISVTEFCKGPGVINYHVVWVTLDKGFDVQCVFFEEQEDAEGFAELLRRSYKVITE